MAYGREGGLKVNSKKRDDAIDAIITAFKELKAWETNYQNLLAEYEELATLARQQAEELDALKKNYGKLVKEHLSLKTGIKELIRGLESENIGD